MTKETPPTEPRQKRKYTRQSVLAKQLPPRVPKKRKYRRRVKFAAQIPPSIVVPIKLRGITLAVWKKSKSRVEWASSMLQSDPNFQDMVSVLANASTEFSPSSLDATNAAYLLGVEKGLQEARKIIYRLADHEEEPKQLPEADYLPDHPELTPRDLD